MISYRSLLDQISRALPYPSHEARAIGQRLLEVQLGLDPARTLLNTPLQLAADQRRSIDEAISRLKAGEPLQYILGVAPFYGRDFIVRPGVLIPRQETEELVDWILRAERNRPGQISVIDFGTGSGCIAVTLACAWKARARVSALDLSEVTLDVARENASRHGVQINFHRWNMLAPPDSFPFGPHPIWVSNPPYVRSGERVAMARHVTEHEPESALFVSDDDPLVFYRALAQLGRQHLPAGGVIYCEINEALGEACKATFEGLDYRVELRRDLNGKWRMLQAKGGIAS